ncbi:MAG TPA: hypothetical protein VNA25_14415 [Phycisphaerae bacterium]|nr:hypothetical protein [Phycisphaerae bacterium]
MPRQPSSSDDLSRDDDQLLLLGAFLPLLDDLAPIVASIRDAQGIEPPATLKQRDDNLQNHPPRTIEPHVLQALHRVTWTGPFTFLNIVANPAFTTKALSSFLPPPAAQAVAAFIDSLTLHDLIYPTLARSLARYIVVGPMELPQPLPREALGSVFAIPFLGDYMIGAIANRLSNPRTLATRLIQASTAVFRRLGHPARRRVPSRLARDAWVHCTYEELKANRDATLAAAQIMDEQQRETNRYVAIAELHCELFPEEAQGLPDSDERDAYVARLAHNLRVAHKRFRDRLSQALPKPPDTPTA